jgi:hypothetical protein
MAAGTSHDAAAARGSWLKAVRRIKGSAHVPSQFTYVPARGSQ